MDGWSNAALTDSSLVAELVLNLGNSTSSFALPPWVKWNVRNPRSNSRKPRSNYWTVKSFLASTSERGASPPALIGCTEESTCNAAGSKMISELKEEELFKQKDRHGMTRTVAWVTGNSRKHDHPDNTDLKKIKKIKFINLGTPGHTSGRQP